MGAGEKILEIRLLGELEVVRDGRSLELPASKKTRALLAYLVATSRPQLREKLCELLWEGPDDPRASVRWSLTKIRPLVDQGKTVRLQSDRERIAFVPEGADVDLVAVRALGSVAQAPLEALRQAAARFRGEFLEGLDLPDCYRFHEWCVGERESLHSLRIAVLDTLVERLRAEPEEALRYARARLAIDPLVESAHAQVVRLLGELGRKAEALKQYDTCKRLLESELGTKPGHELERIRMALGAQTPAAPPAPASPTHTASPTLTQTSTRLVGRQKERAVLQELVAAASVGRAHEVLVLMGDPGIGKSRLLEEVRALVRSTGGLVLAGRAFEAEMVRPYGAWIDALRSMKLEHVDPALRADLSPLLPELGSAGGGDRIRLFDAVTKLLSQLAAQAPLALVLDDLHWFDEASAALLHYVARQAEPSRILLACGARPGELADNPAALKVLRALGREGRLRQLALAPLDAADIAELVRAVDGSLDVARVFAESDGNPLFALEVSRALAGGEDAPISDSLEGLIAERLARLDDRARNLVPWAAALGHGFSAELLAQTTGMAPGDLLAAIDELERRSVLRASESGYDFAHDLIRRAAYRQLSEPRRRLVHGQIARAMAALPDPDAALAGDIAHHAALAGDHETAARACLAAGARCLRLFANSEALEVADRGLAHLSAVSQQVRAELRVYLLRTKVFALRGKWTQHSPTLDADISRAVLEAQAAGLHKAAGDGLFSLSALHHDSEDFEHAEEEILAALEAMRGADPRSLAVQLASTGRCIMQIEGDIERARTALLEAAGLASRVGLDNAEVDWGFGLLNYWDGDLATAATRLQRALDLVRSQQDRWREYQCLEWLARIELEKGRITDERCRDLLEVAAKMGGGSEVPFAKTMAALARLSRGQDAFADVEQALAGLRDADSRTYVAYAQNYVAELDLGAGRPDDAARRAEEALAAALLVRRRTEAAIARAILARAALARGDRSAAEEHLLPVLPQLDDRHALSLRARLAVQVAARALGLPVPTLDSTTASTPAS